MNIHKNYFEILEERIKLEAGEIFIKEIEDSYGSAIHELWVDNGVLRFSVILERGMDIGTVYLKDTCMTWNRDIKHELHPKNVDLKSEGWEKGFYAGISTLGPEVFGTPDETNTDHGTGDYSIFLDNTLKVSVCGCNIEIKANIPIKGYSYKQIYQKEIMIQTKLNSNFIIRNEVSVNVSENTVPIDDGYHIQFSGEYMKEGGTYLLPIPKGKMLLRDSAPTEINPKRIYPYKELFEPIRCYQYIPEKVYGLDRHKDTNWIDFIRYNPNALTAEMLVNDDRSKGSIIIRPLDSFPRTLIAKRNDGCAMYAIEPCKTRPNSLRQKAIDGELQYLNPHESKSTNIAFGFFEQETSIRYFEKLIESAADYEKKLERESCDFQ